MELLDQLEHRIGALLEKLDALGKENAALKEGKTRELASVTEDNNALRQELERERAKTAASLSRLEGLISLIKEQTDQE
jgi:FtsZ-binding cell division protein ZapB